MRDSLLYIQYTCIMAGFMSYCIWLCTCNITGIFYMINFANSMNMFTMDTNSKHYKPAPADFCVSFAGFLASVTLLVSARGLSAALATGLVSAVSRLSFLDNSDKKSLPAGGYKYTQYWHQPAVCIYFVYYRNTIKYWLGKGRVCKVIIDWP